MVMAMLVFVGGRAGRAWGVIWGERQRRSPRGSDREGIEIADVARGEAGHGEGRLAGVAVGARVFGPPLGGREVAVDRPEQRRPLEAPVRAVVAAVAGAEAEVPPEPLGGG